jgi:hypothetical protein
MTGSLRRAVTMHVRGMTVFRHPTCRDVSSVAWAAKVTVTVPRRWMGPRQVVPAHIMPICRTARGADARAAQ